MLEGYALHSGAYSRVRLFRDEGPVRFRRGRVEIPATVASVGDTRRCTVLAREGASVALVEHLLAALHVTSWWRDVLVEVEAAELPILDGSAAPWLEPIAALGAPPVPPAGLEPARTFEVTEEQSRLRLTPGPRGLRTEIFFEHPAIGHQVWQGGPARYRELLDARTFGFMHEVEALRRVGLAAHVTLENAIVYGDEGPLTPLRHRDEPVRHKALDALGDLFLLGRPLEGELDIVRGSHSSHVAFVRALLAGEAVSPEESP